MRHGTTIAATAVLLASLFLFGSFALLNDTVAKNSMTYIDEARAFAGQFELNSRETPSFHPLYSSIIAAVHTSAASWRSTAWWVSVFSMSGFVLLLWVWGRRIDGPIAGWAAALLGGSNILVITYSGAIMAEALGLLLFTGAIALVWEIGHRSRWWMAAFPGLVIGLFALARTEGVPLIGYAFLPLMVLLWLSTRQVRTVAMAAAAFVSAATIVFVPYMVHLYPFNDRVSIYPDVEYFKAASALRRIPDSQWSEIQSMAPGTPTTEDYVGIRTVDGIVGKVVYTVREYGEFIYNVDQSLLGSLFTIVVLLALGLSFVRKRSEDGESQRLLILYLWYFVGFNIVAMGVVVAAYDLEIDVRRLLYLVPPVIMLASIGIARAADTVFSDDVARWPNRFSRYAPGVIAGAILAVHLVLSAFDVRVYLENLRIENAKQKLTDEAGAFIREYSGVGHPVVAADDLNMAFASDGWYVPVHDTNSETLKAAREEGSHVLAVQGTGSASRRPGMGDLLMRQAVPEGLQFVREFGDTCGFHIVLYRFGEVQTDQSERRTIE